MSRYLKSSLLGVLALTALLASSGTVRAQVILSEGFNGSVGPGFLFTNNSDSPNTTNSPPYFGFSTTANSGSHSFIVNFNATIGTLGTETISFWMMTPEIALDNGTIVSFFTRTTGNPASFPDRLQLRMSTNGSSSNAGTLAEDVGDFTTLMLDINPLEDTTTYPGVFTQFNATISGLGAPTTGRLAFRYYVHNAGPFGTNSDAIRIDDLLVTAVPEPGSMALCGLVAGFGAWRLRRRKVTA